MPLENGRSTVHATILESSEDTEAPVPKRTARSVRESTQSAIMTIRTGLVPFIVLTLALAAGVTVATAGATAATEDGTLELIENTSTDETVTVDLRTSVSNVAGYQAELRYDSDILDVTSVDGVELNDPVTNDSEAGVVTFTQSQQRGVDKPTLATITFAVVDGGETDLEFVADETIVNDENGSHLNVTLEGHTVDTAADESGSIGGIGGGSGQDNAESAPDDAEADDDNADETVDNDSEADETVDDEQSNTSDEEDSADETADDEQSPDSDDSGTFSDATPLVSEGILALALSILLVMIGGRMLRWRQ